MNKPRAGKLFQARGKKDALVDSDIALCLSTVSAW